MHGAPRAAAAAGRGRTEEMASRPRPEGMGERSRQRVGRAAATVAPCRPGRASSPSPRPRPRSPRPSSWGSPRSRSSTPEGVAAGPTPRPGAPPLTLELGVRADREAVALRRAARLYADGRRRRRRAGVRAIRLTRGARRAGVLGLAGRDRRSPQPARRAFTRRRRSSSSTSASRSSGRGWPGRRTHGARRQRRSRTRRTRSPPATSSIPTSPAASRSSSRPCPSPRASTTLAPAAQLDLLRKGAETGVDGKLLYGVALQRLGRQRSAEARVRRRREGGPGQRRGAGRGRGRAVRQGAAGRGVLAPRAADAALPGPGDGALPPRPPAPLGRRGEGGEDTARPRHAGGAGIADRPRGGALPGRTAGRQVSDEMSEFFDGVGG